MRIVVLGAGSVGMVFGGLLAEGGHHVALLGREQHMASIKEKGLLIQGIWGIHRVRNLCCYSSLYDLVKQESSAFDVALLTVKAYDTDVILQELRNLRMCLLTISLQNGLGNLEKVSAVMGSGRALAGSVLFGTEIQGPGNVLVAVYAEEVKIGGNDKVDYQRVIELADVFSRAGIPTLPTRDITRHIWGKVLYNCSLNGLAALLEVPYGVLGEHETGRILVTRIVEEAFDVLKREQVQVDWPDAAAYCNDLFGRLLPLTADHFPSMLSDFQAGRRTEIDALNGALVSRAKSYGLDMPVNWLVTKLVEVKEKRVRSEE
ncbi:MAG TPA: ketopantoate reductase family protein [Thermodesulfobacteriota bacterium]|nr:ketopantoate reductase family protein [Thermodesulfobacteriota bacterium]HNU72331.1 ketopantoate reductase family protein [Thermodesulfobacteriota bacterium]HOC39198.1 ketopantoate reductase family protein [Thermodesulfobacteriota bacterium]